MHCLFQKKMSLADDDVHSNLLWFFFESFFNLINDNGYKYIFFFKKKSFFFLTLVCVPTRDIFFVAQSNKFMRKYFFLKILTKNSNF